MSYDEHLISMAGGDGQPITLLDAWNLGFTEACYQHRLQRENPSHPITRTEPDYLKAPPAPATPRTAEWTLDELFPSNRSWLQLGYGAWFCQECSAIVNVTAKHVAWHNKLLP